MKEKDKKFSKLFLKEPLIKRYSKVTWEEVQDVR